ncbi:MAG: FtsX-like permease family protein [Chitinivibrionales bacterium]|nr:FtsX-like permease family protein [Chitinivibrionales bacterium]
MILSMAFKNIFRDRRRSFTLGINYFFIALLLLLLFAISAGMKKNITTTVISSSAGHITISGEYIVKGRTSQGIKDYPTVSAVIKKTFPDATVITRYSLGSAVYYKGLSKRLSFIGIDSQSDRALAGQLSITGGSWQAFVNQPNAVIMPQGVADYFGLGNTDELLLATRTRLGAFNTATMQVQALTKTGNYFLRELLICHFDFLQSLDLADSTIASKMYIFFPTLRNVAGKRQQLLSALESAGFIAIKPASRDDALNAVSAASPRYKVQDESVNQKRLTLATADEVTGIVSQVVSAINSVGLFIAAIMLFIISVSIFINMRMTINERMQEIGTLRAIGAESEDIILLFIAENVLLSLLFVAAGIAVGLLIIGVMSTFITLPPQGTLGLFLSNGHIVLHPTLNSIFFIIALLCSCTALFSFFPARQGGKIPAVVAMNKVN